ATRGRGVRDWGFVRFMASPASGHLESRLEHDLRSVDGLCDCGNSVIANGGLAVGPDTAGFVAVRAQALGRARAAGAGAANAEGLDGVPEHVDVVVAF